MKVIKRRRETNQTAEISRTKKVYIPRHRSAQGCERILFLFLFPQCVDPDQNSLKKQLQQQKNIVSLGLTHKRNL
jgi:hypothetical protein